MSSDKISDLLIEEVIRRIKAEYSLKGEKEVAELIGISPQNFSKKKTKKTVINDIFQWALINDKDLNLLFKSEQTNTMVVKEIRCINYEYLDKIREWISKKLIEDPRNKNWFEVEFEKVFQDFKEWKEKSKEEHLHIELKNQAGGGGRI